MKIILTESQLKSFLKSEFGLDLTGKIEMITSTSQIPYEFDKHFDSRILNRYLNEFGPMYLLTLGTFKKLYYLYQKRKHGVIIVNSDDYQITEDELMKILGIHGLGLTFENLIDEYFSEESLNEQVEEEDDNMGKIIQSYLNMNIPNYYGIKRFWVDYNEHFDRYEINIFFDRQIAIDMGGGINMLIRNAISSIKKEIENMFTDLGFAIFQHFED